ncbi:MAG TPA: VOC family protein [Streptosporangiaceae bacterium]|jgi:catechol 2,3-dioxygenase-like lactoylglutathione lyase family enzyme
MLSGAAFVGFIPARDAGAARAFYEGVLGLRVVESSPFALILDLQGTTLRVTSAGDFIPQPFTVAGWHVQDVAAEVRALQAKGVEFARYDGMEQDELGIWTAPSGDRVAWFRDPDGNTLSLTTLA